MNLGIYLSGEGELDKAEEHYRFGLSIDPEFSLLQYQYGYFLAYRRDDFLAALPFVEEAVRPGTDTVGFLANAGQHPGGAKAFSERGFYPRHLGCRSCRFDFFLWWGIRLGSFCWCSFNRFFKGLNGNRLQRRRDRVHYA